MNTGRTKHFVYLALLSAMAIVLSLVESIYIGPIFFLVRLGLANIVSLVTIRLLGVKEMIIVNAMRVVIASLMRGMLFGSTFWISLGGVMLSSIVLVACDHFDSSLMFTSVCSSIAH
ncbi:MAG: Gx transporter family protein, partial [Solobacterium sp.]|nr:Gx transporter family protein [Solobacterium sp.]